MNSMCQLKINPKNYLVKNVSLKDKEYLFSLAKERDIKVVNNINSPNVGFFYHDNGPGKFITTNWGTGGKNEENKYIKEYKGEIISFDHLLFLMGINTDVNLEKINFLLESFNILL